MSKFRGAVVALAAAVVLALPQAAWADSLTGSSNWLVSYTTAGQMQDNYSASQYADEVGSLQPGDDITFTVALKHEYAEAADWYLANEVLKSLEEGAATGSAYGYRLTYINPAGTEQVLYDSDVVGGTDSTGLLGATSALEDFLYLDNLSQGQSASVKLLVTLDGETEGNAYFDTLARLQLKFAVDPTQSESIIRNNTTTVTQGNTPNNTTTTQTPSSGTTTRGNDATRSAVQTGDDTNLLPFYIAMVGSGVLLALLGVYSLRARRREQ